MKKADLIEIIRVVVREEISNSLPQYLMEVLAEKIAGGSEGQINEHTEPVVQKKSQPVRRGPLIPPQSGPKVELEEPFSRRSAPVPKVFSGNSPLTEALNSTVGGVPTEEEVGTASVLDTFNGIPPEVLNENKAMSAVNTALKKDYSSLLKAIDKKVKR